MDVLMKILQVVLALSLLIFIHELGHFMWARIFGIRVDKFFLFFDVGGKALFRFRKGETEFGIGWLPLGGYCKISGMVDESMDLEQLKQEPEPWEFRTHPAGQRLMVMAGGVLNNFIFAILVYACIMAIWGQSFISNKGSKIYVNDLAFEMGFRNGDEILKLDDYVPEDFAYLQADMVRKGAQTATVLRGTDTLQLYIDHSMTGQILNSPMMFDLAVPFVIDSVAAGGPNAASRLERQDKVIAFDGEKIEFVQDAREVLLRKKGMETTASVVRGGDTIAVNVCVDTAGLIGVYMEMPNIEYRHYNMVSAIPEGLKLTWNTICGYLQDLKLIASPQTGAYKSVGSFIAIGQVFPSSWNWYQFLDILALLSIMLGVMNLIPIPGLDGGHILFTLYEIVTGRKPGDKFLAAAQMAGLVLLILLMLLAFGNDIGRLIQ